MKKEIPDLVIIDLDQENAEIPSMGSDGFEEPDKPDELGDSGESGDPEESDEEPGKRGFRINMHIVLLATAIIVFSLILYRILNWGNFISQEDIFKDGDGTYENVTFDNIVPLLDENGDIMHMDHSDGLTIVTFGNSPFADDRGSEDNLASLIAGRTNATVYNCAISGSYLASENLPYDSENYPMDAYCLYWLSALVCGENINYYYDFAAKALGDETPPEAAEVIGTLNSIDFNTVDAIIIMYDAADYLMGHPMINYTNDQDVQSFTGNLTASIELLRQVYPHIRIIVLSPSYAFAIDENGEYVSSDVQRYGHDVLSSYIIYEMETCYNMGVSIVDNLYGTITEDNASEYLIDNLHLNPAGRRLIADRAVEALLYYEELGN